MIIVMAHLFPAGVALMIIISPFSLSNMVQIKEGYVMTPREQAEYERVNALPRRTSGTVAYYFKPQTKYPARIYVFIHAEIWCDRNRRPMGLFHAFPFLTRPMNSGEIEYHHFDTRLCYHQYEDWSRLLYAEEKEAEELDREKAGSGTQFIDKLRSFQDRFPLEAQVKVSPTVLLEPSESEEMRYLIELLTIANKLSAAEVGALLDREQQGEKRITILILLREMYKETAGAANQLDKLTAEGIKRRAERSIERSRKNFVRRVYRDNPLFAVEEIRLRYPGYEIDSLAADLKRKPAKIKAFKAKLVFDLRRVQLQKLAVQLKQFNADDQHYHALCVRMAILEDAHRNRCPIPIAVRLQGKTEVYYFHWKTRETVVKAFVEFANLTSQTHDVLKVRHHEITSSHYSF